MILLLQPVTMGTATAQTIPDWVKQSADWWLQGLISDREFAATLAFLVKENIIRVEGIEIDSQGIIVIDANISIPTWIRNNIQWWIDGVILESEFLSAIQFMLKEEIISFKEKPKILKSDISSETAQLIFETAKQNELSMKYLQKIKAAEYEDAKNAYDSAVNDYSKNKDKTSMNTMNNLGNAEKIAKEELLQATKILKSAVQSANDAKDTADKSGSHVIDLDKAVSDTQSKIDSMNRHFTTESERKSAYKDAQNLQRIANAGLQKTLSSAMSDDPGFQELSSTDKNFVSTIIGGIEYPNFSILNYKQTPNDSNYIPPGFKPKYDGDTPLDLSKEYHHNEHQTFRFLLDVLMIETMRAPSAVYPTDEVVSDSSTSGLKDQGQDSEELTDSWNSNNYVLDITLPDGTTVTVNAEPSEAFEDFINSNIIEGHKKIEKGPPSDTLEESDVTVDESNNNDNTSTTTSPDGLSVMGDFTESTLTGPRDKIIEGLDDYGTPTVIGPYAEYSTDKWTIYVDGEVFYYDTPENAQNAFDELKYFTDGAEIEVNYDTIDDDENSKDVDSNSFAVNYNTIHDIDAGDYLVYRGAAIPGNEVIIWLYNVETLDKITNTVSVDINGNWYHQQYVDVAGEYFTNFASGGVSMTSPKFTVHDPNEDEISFTTDFIDNSKFNVYTPIKFTGSAEYLREITITISDDNGDIIQEIDTNGNWYEVYKNFSYGFTTCGFYDVTIESEGTSLSPPGDGTYSFEIINTSMGSNNWNFKNLHNCEDQLDLVVIDDDKDGIEDSIDIKPNEFSDEFFDVDANISGKIIDRAGHEIRITQVDGTVRIEVRTVSGGTDPAIIEIMDVEMELEPGTIFETDFG